MATSPEIDESQEDCHNKAVSARGRGFKQPSPPCGVVAHVAVTTTLTVLDCL